MSIHSYFDFFIFHRVYLFPQLSGSRTFFIKENYNVPTLVGEIQKIHRQEAVLHPDDFIYIRHETSCYHVPISPSPSTTPLNVTRSRPRRLAPDPLGRGQK